MRVYQRGKRGNWWIDISVDGKRIKRSAGTTDKRQAEEYAASFARDLWRQRRLGDAPRVTWDEAVIAWIAKHEHRKSIEEIKRVLRWLTARLQGKTLASITTKTVGELVAERKTPKKLGAKPSSNGTVNRHLAQLSAVLHFAQRSGWLAALPTIELLPEPKKRVAWLTHDEARRLLEELPSHLKPIAAFGLATGLRETNIRMLTWAQVDTARAVAWVYGDEAKGGKNLHVPLNDAALLVLAGQRGKHARWVFPVPRWLAKQHPGDAPVQVADHPTGKVSNHAWRKACVRAGVPTLRFHDLRHTWASWHVQAGTPPAVLQELGGWASQAMVQKYAHLGESHLSAWAGNIGCGTSSAQVVPEDPAAAQRGRANVQSDQALTMGWLMGLEPTTTRITIGSGASGVSRIKHLQAPRKPKAA
jgi:integrase